MRLFFSILFLSCSGLIHAVDPITVGLFQGTAYSKVTITIASGTYSCGEKAVFIVGNNLVFTNEGGKVRCVSGERSFDFGAKAYLKHAAGAEVKITPDGTKAAGNIYPEDIIITASNGKLMFFNRLDIERYVPGVIEAEGGKDHEAEYYKVQAVISRTYALNNLRRHEAEGFNVCDGTHCQVYHGRARHEPLAISATKSTEDVVIVDDNIDLITAVFHSNCGGHTVNAEDVWSKSLSYCVGRTDTFCLAMPHSNWEKSIPEHQWLDYLQSKRYPVEDSAANALSFFPSQKQVYFVDSTFGIPLRVMRQDLKLRSTFFTVHSNQGEVTLIGQGFGHGVGLCQEGAMRMAQLGYTYDEIIHFYYKDVHLVPKRFIWFFKAD